MALLSGFLFSVGVSFYTRLTAGPRSLAKPFPVSHPNSLTEGAERVRAGGWDGEAGEDKAALAAAQAGAARTPAGSPLTAERTQRLLCPKRKVRKPVLAVTASAPASHR